jgi:hypothetical protein
MHRQNQDAVTDREVGHGENIGGRNYVMSTEPQKER